MRSAAVLRLARHDGDNNVAAADEASDLVSPVLRLGVALAIAAVAAQSVADLVNFAFLDRSVGQLNADAEPNVWSWASTIATACAGLSLLLLALVRVDRRPSLALVAAATAFLSLDDALQIHERARFGGWEDSQRVLWPALYLPLLLAVFVVVWRIAGEVASRAGVVVRLGLCFLAAAVAGELAGAVLVAIGRGTGTFAYELEVIVEEGLEIGGWILISTGIIADMLDRVARAGTVPRPV